MKYSRVDQIAFDVGYLAVLQTDNAENDKPIAVEVLYQVFWKILYPPDKQKLLSRNCVWDTRLRYT